MAIFKNICNRWNFMILKMKIFRWFKSCLIFWLLLPWAEITFSVHHHIFHVNDINLHIKVKVMIQIFAFQICCWFKYFDPRNSKKYFLYIRKYVIFIELMYENINANISFESHHQIAKYCQKDSICPNISTFNDGMMYA